MGRPRKAIPSYLRHSSGQARVIIDGVTYYLGTYDSPESKARYARLLEELQANGGHLPYRPRQRPGGPTVAEVLAAWWEAEGGDKLPKSTRYLALRSMAYLDRQGDVPVSDYGSAQLFELRRAALHDHVRQLALAIVRTARGVFVWAAATGLITDDVPGRLRALPPVKESEAHSNPEVEPIDLGDAERVIAELPAHLAAVARLQLLTGSRGGEILALTPGDLSRKGSVWTYRLKSHKTAKRGKKRTIYFGPQAQAILVPFLLRPAAALCFPNRSGRRYTSAAYYTYWQRAAAKAGVQDTHPHQLRHTGLERILEAAGEEAAQGAAGHASPEMTAHYTRAARARQLDEAARKAARKIG